MPNLIKIIFKFSHPNEYLGNFSKDKLITLMYL